MRMIHPTSWRYYHNNNVILPITKMMILLVVVMVIYHVVPHSSSTMVSSFHMVTPKRTRMMHHSNHYSPLPPLLLRLLRLNEHSCTKSTLLTSSSSSSPTAATALVKSQHFDPNPFVRNHNRITTTITNSIIIMRMMMISSSSILVLLVSLFPSVSYAALDMEAFAAQQLQPPQIVMTAPTSSRIASSSTSTNTDTMTPDEALCRFGQPGLLKGDACVRAHMSTAPKTKQGVDAYGNIQSRNTYPKCTKQYTLVDQQYYTSEWICQ